MADSVVVTFADIEFMLKARAPEHVQVGEQLGVSTAGEGVAAGLASLLARGLCTRVDERVTPAEEVSVIIAALSIATRGTRAMGWVADRVVLTHYFTGPVLGVAMQALELGQFRVHVLDPGRTLVDQLGAFLDVGLAAGQESAVLIQSMGEGGTVSVTVATDPDGAWLLSDSAADLDRSKPVTRDAVLARLTELLDAAAVGT